jgi:tetratricopeptide (TPR) repeat protein
MSKEWCVYTAHVAVAVSLVWVGASQMQGQISMGSEGPGWPGAASFDMSRPNGGSWGGGGFGDRGFSPEFGSARESDTAAMARRDTAPLISTDRLRNPLALKALKLINKAQAAGEKGDHESAIRILLETREKYPSSAAYVHSLLGIEYAKTSQYSKAEDELRHAVALMPHEAVNHSNLAYALCFLGKFDEAEASVRRALELDKDNRAAQKITRTLLERKTAIGLTP